MTRLLPVVLLVALAMPGAAACRRLPGDVRAVDAAAALRATPEFTRRSDSPAERELLQILAVRRIGNSSCEVEFTWRNKPRLPGQTIAPARTSMALFRLQEDGLWRLTSLFKVD